MLPGIASIGGLVAAASPFSASFLQAAGQTSSNFGSRSLGALPTGSDRRFIVIAASTRDGDVSAINLAGSPITSIVNQASAGSGDGVGSRIGIVENNVDASATVTITGTGDNDGYAISMYRLLNWSGAVYDTAVDTATPLALTIDIPTNGVAICAASLENGSSGNTSWANATERVDFDVSTNDMVTAADRFATDPETAVAIAASLTGATAAAGCAASFGGA